MSTVSIHQAKTHLSRLVEDAAAGDEIVIAKAGKPVARLMPLTEPARTRRIGVSKGKPVVPDDSTHRSLPKICVNSESTREAAARHTRAALGAHRRYPVGQGEGADS